MNLAGVVSQSCYWKFRLKQKTLTANYYKTVDVIHGGGFNFVVVNVYFIS